MTTPAAGAGQVGGSWEPSGDRRRHLHVAETKSASSASAVAARMEGGTLGTVPRMLGPGAGQRPALRSEAGPVPREVSAGGAFGRLSFPHRRQKEDQLTSGHSLRSGDGD